MFNRAQTELAAKLKTLAIESPLEKRLKNYQQWLDDNPNAQRQSILWHKRQIFLIQKAIRQRDSQ